MVKTDAYKYFNTRQTGIMTNYSDNDGTDYEALINQTSSNVTHVGDYVTTTSYYVTHVGDYVTTTPYSVTQVVDYMGKELLDNIVIYCNMTFSIFGLLGHVLSLIILLRPPFSEMPHSIFCAALAFIDLAYMLMQLNVTVIRLVVGKQVLLINSVLCKFVASFIYLNVHLDAWTLVGLSGERLVAVFLPLRAKLIITKFRIKTYLVIMFILITLFHGEASVRYDLVDIRKGDDFIKNCQPAYFYGLPKKFFVVKDKMLLFLLSAIPLIIISVFNIAILIKLAHRRRQQSQLGVNTNNNLDTRMNAMLIGVMLVFVLLNFPAQAYVVSVFIQEKEFNESILRLLILFTTVSIGLNFYLYFLTSGLFRKAVQNLFQFKSNVEGQARCSLSAKRWGPETGG